MKNNPIDIMYAEHDIIKKAESIIINCDQLWETDPQGYTELINKLIIFFREYADGYHHYKEEDVLFPAINNHPDFILQGLIFEFNQHHESFREYTKEIEEALAVNDFTNSYNILSMYCNDLLDHIAAENEELFVLAENLLDEPTMENIYFKFQDIDRQLGEARKKELEESIEAIFI